VAAIVTVIGALGAFLVGFAQLLLAHRIRRLDPTTLEQHIEHLEAAAELDDLEVQIQEHRAIVDKLSHDAETYQHLKDLNRHELAAVSQVLARELKKEGRRSFWVNFATNFGFFVAGVVVTLVLSYVTLVLS
jgi:hypothetical protein